MDKKVLAVLLASTLALTTVACGNNDYKVQPCPSYQVAGLVKNQSYPVQTVQYSYSNNEYVFGIAGQTVRKVSASCVEMVQGPPNGAVLTFKEGHIQLGVSQHFAIQSLEEQGSPYSGVSFYPYSGLSQGPVIGTSPTVIIDRNPTVILRDNSPVVIQRYRTKVQERSYRVPSYKPPANTHLPTTTNSPGISTHGTSTNNNRPASTVNSNKPTGFGSSTRTQSPKVRSSPSSNRSFGGGISGGRTRPKKSR